MSDGHGKVGIRWRRNVVVLVFQHLCSLCVCRSSTRLDKRRKRKSSSAHPQTEEGPSKRSDLLHRPSASPSPTRQTRISPGSMDRPRLEASQAGWLLLRPASATGRSTWRGR